MSTPNEHSGKERGELGNSAANPPHPKPPRPDADDDQPSSAQPGYQAPPPQAGLPTYETPTPPAQQPSAGFGGAPEAGPRYQAPPVNTAGLRSEVLRERLTNTNGVPREIKFAYFLWVVIAIIGLLMSIRTSFLLNSGEDSLGTAATVTSVLLGLVFGLVYIFLAVRMKEGANWARAVLSVFAALSVIAAVLTFAAPFSLGMSIGDWLLSVATVLAGGLMWLPNARAWFKEQSKTAAQR